MKALIVDDHIIFRSTLISFLKDFKDVEIVGEAANGFEALQAIELLRPNLLLMDIQMPGMNGLEVAEMIKKNLPEIKIVLITIHEDEEYKVKSQAIGAEGFVSKKSITEELPKVLQQISN